MAKFNSTWAEIQYNDRILREREEAKKSPYLAATFKHMSKVRNHLDCFVHALLKRGEVHDQSKLQEPELSAYSAVFDELKQAKFNSPEYEKGLEKIAPAIKHHRENNSHHPEFYEDGVDGMDLVDLIEMYCDWKAASERNADGDFSRSLDICGKKYKLSNQLDSIFKNTYKNWG